jgi:chromosome segregation ATPase
MKDSMASQRISSQAADSQSSGSHGTGPQLPASAEAHEQREIIRDLRKELASVRSQIVHTQRERDDAEISSQSDIKRNAEVQLEMQEKIDSLRIRIRTLDSENEAKDAIISKLQAQLVAAESDAASNDPAVQKKDSA